jgi:arylformamidase
VSGHSAGGHLTAMMFATDWSAFGMPESAIVGGVALSGLFDLEPLIHTSINRDLSLDEQTAKALSPIHLRPRINGPMIAAVGALESNEFRRQTGLICAAWPENCVGPTILDGYHHFSMLEALPELISQKLGER